MKKSTSSTLQIKKNCLFFIILFFVLCTFPHFTNATYGGVETGGGDANNANSDSPENQMLLFGQKIGLTTATDTTLEEKIINYINVLLSFLGLILLILIIIAGIQWMTSGGNEEAITKSKNRIKNAVIGLFIIIASWMIANTIMKIILNGTTNNTTNNSTN